ncbi:hypothetical protein FDP41_013777 [Naegleria fowleri]|uniref:Uncharacterized protein n=1 Tax=Naegleria fowleri TaxID=5763 RepID=A0A6A5C2K6_NAEFO|nr:uncharacterized protein FDP41_013777 [Naegleria fowleri]KAF0980128.1 hypothetical protein FDP41_013777 [Naegleria fowleri]
MVLDTSNQNKVVETPNQNKVISEINKSNKVLEIPNKHASHKNLITDSSLNQVSPNNQLFTKPNNRHPIYLKTRSCKAIPLKEYQARMASTIDETQSTTPSLPKGVLTTGTSPLFIPFPKGIDQQTLPKDKFTCTIVGSLKNC